MAITTHMCRGNFRSSWAAEGGYDFVAEALFGGLDVDGFLLGVRRLALGGLRAAAVRTEVQARRPRTGHDEAGRAREEDDLKRRIDEAARYVPLDQLCLSPQCGFSSTVEGNALSYDDQWAKLALVVETAEEVWG